MNLIKSFIQKIKERKSEKAAELVDHQKKERERVLGEYKDQLESILSKPCAIKNFSNCDKACVHFNEGGAFSYEYEGYKYFYVDSPKCKLWK